MSRQLTKPVYGSVLKHLDRPDGLAENSRRLGQGEVPNDPQSQDIPLVRRQDSEQVGQSLGADPAQHDGLHVGLIGQVFELADIGGRGGAPCSHPSLIDETSVRDREQPRAKTRLVPLEGSDSPGCCQEDLADHIVRLGRAPQRQECFDAGCRLGVQTMPCPLGPGLRSGQHRIECFTNQLRPTVSSDPHTVPSARSGLILKPNWRAAFAPGGWTHSILLSSCSNFPSALWPREHAGLVTSAAGQSDPMAVRLPPVRESSGRGTSRCRGWGSGPSGPSGWWTTRQCPPSRCERSDERRK